MLYFSPLQGYTEDVYRRLHHQIFGGIDSYFTPFVRLEHGNVRSKDLRDIKPENNVAVPVIPQIITGDGKEAQQLIDVITPLGYRSIDINMGCPFPLQTRHGKGAGILTHPDKVKEIKETIEKNTDVTFSVKMRLGLDSYEDWKEILPILNDTPLHHITLHPRIATQQYKGNIDMTKFESFLEMCKHPVIYNGDIMTLNDINSIESQYNNLAGIMIGRGLLARPSLAIEYKTGTEWSRSQIISKVREMHSLLLEQYTKIIPGEAQLLQKVRTFWDFYEPQDSNSLLERKKWKKIKKAGNMKNYLQAITEI